MKYLLKPLLIVTLMGICAKPLAAQDPGVFVYGTVREMVSKEAIPFPIVEIQEIGSELPPTPIVTNERGRYEIHFTQQKVYEVRYGALGKVGKVVHLDLRGPSEELWQYGYGINIDVTVLDSLPDVDYSILLEPFGKASFDPGSEVFEWDMEYTQGLRDRQAALLEEYYRRREEKHLEE